MILRRPEGLKSFINAEQPHIKSLMENSTCDMYSGSFRKSRHSNVACSRVSQERRRKSWRRHVSAF